MAATTVASAAMTTTSTTLAPATGNRNWTAVATVPQQNAQRHGVLQQQQQQQQQHRSLLGRKQHSFSEVNSFEYSRNGYLSRGTSADRIGILHREGLQQKLRRTRFQLHKHSTIDTQTLSYKLASKAPSDSQRQQPKIQSQQQQQQQQRRAYINLLNNDNNNIINGQRKQQQRKNGTASAVLKQKKHDPVIAWSSTSSLLKAFNDELSQDTYNNRGGKSKSNSKNNNTATQTATQNNSSSTPHEVNRVNLNIVLSQTIRATNDTETAGLSDVDSCSEAHDPFAPQAPSYSTFCNNENFQSSHHNTAFTCKDNNIITGVQLFSNGNATKSSDLIRVPADSNQTVTDISTVQRRPIVRAMSAPVRYEDNSHHNSSKSSNIIANKRKTRNRSRKPITRNISCDTTAPSTAAIESNKREQKLLLDDGNKKLAARAARSTTVTDIITLVSLIDTELSDSEKEDDTSASHTSNSESTKTTNARAPLLRKTGKSVSFQENFVYPPNYQLAAKEYSHMIRRGSVAPLVTRLRPNVRSAPPASIFLSDNERETSTVVVTTTSIASVMADESMMVTSTSKICSNKVINEHQSDGNRSSEKENLVEGQPIITDFVYPQYVRSLKERECWKLYQKMADKGVSVSYETVLRGMLTPTEFRQVQKQRELEEIKLRSLEELEQECENGNTKKSPTSTSSIPAIERPIEALLKK